MINELEVRKTLDVMKHKNGIFEVRIIGNTPFPFSGYFKDVDKLIEAIRPYNSDNIYFVLNEINDACYSRTQCEKIEKANKTTKTTSDDDIEMRRYILIDIDPERPSGVSATNEEIEKAKIVGNKVYLFLKSQGFQKPITAFSGNGVHLLYKVQLHNNEANKDLIKSFLETLDMLFSDEYAKVDTSVFNAGRITKLYGTCSRKGSSTPERPHRESRILTVPESIEVTQKAFIEKIVGFKPKAEPKTWKNNYQGNSQFNLEDFIQKHNIDVKKRTRFRDGEKLIIDCPFNENHKQDGAIFKLNDGSIGFHCFHNSCQGHDWSSFRNFFDPNRRDKNYIAPNRYSGVNHFGELPTTPQKEDISKGKKFLAFNEIKDRDRSSIISIPTGFTELDKKIIGLNLGELSIVSGINGSGKSAVIKQLGLNAVNANYNIVEYSGELDSTRSKSWTMLQAAGRIYTEPTRYENYFRVPENISNLISKWIDHKWLVYNNDYSNNLSQLVIDIEEQITKQETHIVIIDNIMSLELSDLGSDKYENQKKAVKTLHDLAQKYKVHVIVVAHPRKTMGFLRKEDIAGSGDMINLAENIFIVHRVNNDFIKRFPEFVGEDKASDFIKYGNVLEVAKNRDLGCVDHFVGLYYEIASKRFLNDFTDTPYYGWQDLLHTQQTFSYNEDVFMNEKQFTTTDTDVPF